MKKVYSKKVGGEVFALAPEQLEVFRNAGYQTPAPEEVIADAGAATAYVPKEMAEAFKAKGAAEGNPQGEIVKRAKRAVLR